MKLESVIFLDIDGVLATDSGQNVKKKFWYDDKAYPFNENCVKPMNIILKLINPEIVLTSSWRLFYTLEELGKIFLFNKIIKQPVAITKELGDRNFEIQQFIENNEIKNFVIIDDMDLNCFPEYFIRTKPDIGLHKNHIELVCKILEKNV